MDFLLIFVLPLTFLLYSVFRKDTQGTFAAFIIGLCAGLVSLIIVSFLNGSNLSVSASLSAHIWRFFLYYFLLHEILALVIFFLISFSISGEVLTSSFSALFGIFSSVFIYIFYKNINTPDATELMLFLLIIIGAILIFDFVFTVLIANLTIAADFLIYLIALPVFIVISFLGSYALAVWYLAGSSAVYLSISLGIFFSGLILYVIASRL